MATPPFESNRFWFAAEAMLATAVVALPMAIGGALEWSLWLLLALSIAAATSWLIGGLKHKRRRVWHPVMWLPLAVIALEVIQLVPLPPFMLGLISPHAAELRETALVPLGLTSWRPISMDAPSTLRALARSISLGALLFTAMQVGRSDAARRRLYSVIGAVGAVIAVMGFMHLLAGLDTLFGFYKFAATTPMMSPFGNSNHLASFLTLCSTVALGLALDAKRRDSAIGWGVMALAMGVAAFLSFSRGGIASLLVTWGLVAAYAASRRTGGLRGAFPWLAIAAVIIGAGLLAFEQLQVRADTLDSLDKLRSTKLELWPMFAKSTLAFWPLGMGIGAFELAFSPWQTTQFDVTFTHPENIVLQWASEVGLPAFIALSVLVVMVTRRLWSDLKGLRLEAIMLLAIVGVVIHDVFDFALELNAVPTVAAVLLGLVASVAPETSAPRKLVRPKALISFAMISVVALVAAVLSQPSHLSAEHEVQHTAGDKTQLQTLPQLVRSSIDRHPADWVLYAAMAQVSSQHGDAQNALAWVNRWLWLRPSDAHAHIAAAHALLRLRQRGQALLEYRTAFELGDTNARNLEVALIIASAEHDYERLFVDRPQWLERAWATLGRRDQNEAQVLLEQALANPVSETMRLDAQVLMVRALEARGQLTEAVALLEKLPTQQRDSAVVLRARMLAKLQRTDEAIDLLEKHTAKAPSSVETAYALADVFAGIGKTQAARTALERVQPFVGQASVRSELFQREAQLWSADARHAKALDAWVTASRLEPSRADLHYRVAQAHERLGSYISAIDEVKKGRALDSSQGALAQQAWLEKLQAAQQNRSRPQ